MCVTDGTNIVPSVGDGGAHDYWDTQLRVECVRQLGTLYKLTDQLWESRNRLMWGYGHTARSGEGVAAPPRWMSIQQAQDWISNRETVSGRWLFAYTHPVIASLLNRVHADIDIPLLWECTGEVKHLTIDKVALCDRLTTERPVDMPRIGGYTRMKFAFGCVAKVYKDEVFQDWTLDWVGGRNRSRHKAQEVADHCAKQVRFKDGKMTAVSHAAFAAQWLCWAAIAFDDITLNKVIEHWTAQAAVEANRVAHSSKMRDFDLVTIAEITMGAH